jgi:hypothetical protein
MKRIFCWFLGHRWAKGTRYVTEKEVIHRVLKITFCTRCEKEWEY